MEETDFTKVKFIVLGIFVLIFISIIVYTKSDFYLKREYLRFKRIEFKSTLSNKFDEHVTKANKIYLKNGPELRIPRELFDELVIGDSILKMKNSDSIIFFTNKGIKYLDYNGFRRERFLKSVE